MWLDWGFYEDFEHLTFDNLPELPLNNGGEMSCSGLAAPRDISFSIF